jgi:hypothetical protein
LTRFEATLIFEVLMFPYSNLARGIIPPDDLFSQADETWRDENKNEKG